MGWHPWLCRQHGWERAPSGPRGHVTTAGRGQPSSAPGPALTPGLHWNYVTLSTFYAKTYARPASRTTVGTGTSKEEQEAGPAMARKEEEEGCRSSLPLTEGQPPWCNHRGSKPGQKATSQSRIVCRNSSVSWQPWHSLIPSHKVTPGQGPSAAQDDK